MGLLALKKNFLIRENKSENDIKNVKIKNSNELIYGNEVKNKYCIKINELINSTGMPKFPFVGYTKTKDFEFSLNGQNKDAQYLKGENLKTQTSLVKNSINYEKFSGLSEENRIINFRNFNWSLFRNQKCYGAIENAYKEALSYSRFKTGFNNLLIKGNVGAGKTFISICITNEAIKNEKMFII